MSVPLHFAVYGAFLFLFLLGLGAMGVSRNLMRKLFGLYLFQTSIILFYLSLNFKWQATLPILLESSARLSTDQYMNPLPQALMLTAIVVGVSTLGVALALLRKIHKNFGSLEEDEIL
ncbi:MAG: cation:proton antiporter subunit C [Elusimicrobia bacterium]|nr:cation:proton antiporter subunit C [Elusimicrobiota bacterium]